MKSLILSGVAATAFALSGPAMAAESFSPSEQAGADGILKQEVYGKNRGGHHAPRPSMGGYHGHRGGTGIGIGRGGRAHVNVHQSYGGRPHHGPRPTTTIINNGGPRGFGGFYGYYQRPFSGYTVPTYWLAPSFAVQNYNTLGLYAPQPGYSWSRYYDDAVLRNPQGIVHAYQPNVDWSRGGAGYAPNGYYSQTAPQAQYAPVQYATPEKTKPSMPADRMIYENDGVYEGPAPEGSKESGTYDGEWTGSYDDDQRTYRGEWEGNYKGDDGRVYEGTYRGTATGDPVYRPAANAGAPYPAAYAPAPAPAPAYPQAYAPTAAPAYSVPQGYDAYERCLRNRGIGGGAIGAIIGAVAGNRIAGRGNRTIGTILGGGIGAISGATIEKATKKCTKYLPRYEEAGYAPSGPAYYPQPAPAPQYGAQQPSGHGWNGGYYYVPGGYYYPQAQTQQQEYEVTVETGTATTTTTVYEEYDEYVDVTPTKRLLKPKAKRLRKPGY